MIHIIDGHKMFNGARLRSNLVTVCAKHDSTETYFIGIRYN
jgi:hypothetical protein